MMPEVLVVDDDAPLLRVLALHLENEGYSVRTAPGGREALAQVALHRPDIIVLDAMMPAMSGVEVCRQVRAMEHGDEIRVMMLTANSQVEEAAADAGADTFMTKPFSLVTLSAELRRLRPEVPEGT
ncbi:MAG: two-component system, OmpR family, phosphate regulon response regulator PhoB [Chloroflexota bacterium]|jgi:two-component system phosphate regulon response regulator PhoB|nr:two-component system, OmpR family, phosphate regulon response regulator PhoB [Chloroflexota bacterium]